MNLRAHLNESADCLLAHLRAHPGLVIPSNQVPLPEPVETHYREHYAKVLQRECGDKQFSELDEKMQRYIHKKAGSARIQHVSDAGRVLQGRNVPVYTQSGGFQYVESYDSVRTSIENSLLMIYGRCARIDALNRMKYQWQETCMNIQSTETCRKSLLSGEIRHDVPKAILYWLIVKYLFNNLNTARTFGKISQHLYEFSEANKEHQYYTYIIDAANSINEATTISELIEYANRCGLPVVSNKRNGVQITDSYTVLIESIENLIQDTKTRIRWLDARISQTVACFVDYQAQTEAMAKSLRAFIDSKTFLK